MVKANPLRRIDLVPTDADEIDPGVLQISDALAESFRRDHPKSVAATVADRQNDRVAALDYQCWLSEDNLMRRNGSKNGSLKAPVKPVRVQVALNRAVRRVNRMTQSELRQSLIDCGIVTPGGKLAAMYR